MQKILVIGAGAMGCLFAARMAESGADVLLIDVDEARLSTIVHEGIHLTDDTGERTIALRAGTASAVQEPIDLIVLFTKGMHSRAAIQSVAHLATSDTHVLTIQNGLGNPEIIAETFPADHVLKGMAALPADLEGANRVSSHGAGHVALGSLTLAGRGAARNAVDLLKRAGFDARFSDDIDVIIWEKVAFNAALNALAAVTGQANAGMDNAPGRRIIAAMLDEVVATAATLDIQLDRARITASVDHALAHHRGHKASMLQDMAAGRASEIEFIDGAICAHAQAAGIPVPVTQTMTDLVRLLEQVRQNQAHP